MAHFIASKNCNIPWGKDWQVKLLSCYNSKGSLFKRVQIHRHQCKPLTPSNASCPYFFLPRGHTMKFEQDTILWRKPRASGEEQMLWKYSLWSQPSWVLIPVLLTPSFGILGILNISELQFPQMNIEKRSVFLNMILQGLSEFLHRKQHMIWHKGYFLIPIPCPTRCCIWSSFPVYISPSHRNDLVVSLKVVLYHSRLSCTPNCNIHFTLCRFLLQAKCTILDRSLIKEFETFIWFNKNHDYFSYLKMTPVQMLCPPLTVREREDGGKEEGRAFAYTQECSVSGSRVLGQWRNPPTHWGFPGSLKKLVLHNNLPWNFPPI